MRSSVFTRNWNVCSRIMSDCATNWKPPCALASAKLLHSHAASGRTSPNLQGVSRVRPMAPTPQSPGRKSGKAHGTHHQRPVQDHVDEEIQVNAPAQCPDCGGTLTVERVESQYQEEIVRRTWVRRFH